MMRKLFFLIIVMLFVGRASAQKSEPVYLFQEPDGSPGKINKLTLEDENLHPLDMFWYTENWFFIAVLEDGHIAYVNLMVSNMGLKKLTPALTFTIITPDRKRLTTEAEFKPEDLKMSRDRFSIRIGNNLMESRDRSYHLKLEKDGLGMDLIYVSRVPGFKPGDGKAVFGKKRDIFYYINYPAPRPEVSGTLLINGKSVPVKGWGYMDHCYYNADATAFEDVWHNVKIWTDQYSILLTNFTTPAPYQGPLNIATITDNEKVLCITTDVTVTEGDVMKMSEQDGAKPYPQTISYDLKCANGVRARAAFNAKDVVEKMDVLNKLDKGAANKALKYMINTFIARPFYYRAIGPIEVELTIDGQTAKINGRAVSEVIFTK